MLKCDNVFPQISAFVDRELPLWKIELIRWHIRRCPRCAHEAAYLQQTDQLLRELPTTKAPETFLSDVMQQASSIAVHAQREAPLAHRVAQRTKSKLAWWAYSVQTHTRPYVVAVCLSAVLVVASLTTLYVPKQQTVTEQVAVLTAPIPVDSPITVVSIEIIPADALPKPHLSAGRLPNPSRDP